MQDVGSGLVNSPAALDQQTEGRMSELVVSGRKRASKLLRSAGREFVDGFLSAYNGAIPLRSKEPGLCWKAGGIISFAAISEFSGPNATEEDAPLLMRLRTNLYPPPAVFYHLKSPAVRNKLGVSAEPLIANDPALELTATPEEIGKFGRWLTTWLDSTFYQKPNCPPPPIPLVSWGCGEELEDTREEITQVGRDWRLHLYLWTPTALEAFEAWLKK
jgi:hypothetical protein